MNKQDLELLALAQIRDAGLPEPEREYQFALPRRWRFDYAWPPEKVALAIQGGVWGQYVRCHACGAQVMKVTKKGRRYPVREAGGRHVRGPGFENDQVKYATAAALGWRVIPATKAMLQADQVVPLVRQALEG